MIETRWCLKKGGASNNPDAPKIAASVLKMQAFKGYFHSAVAVMVRRWISVYAWFIP
jgi:hypothetical protein